MEDHFVLIPVMAILSIFYVIWYTVKFVHVSIRTVYRIITKTYKKKILKEEGVNNNYVTR